VWKIYKEGQGKWARVLTVSAIALGSVFAVYSLHNALPAKERFVVPIVNWSVDYRFLFDAPLLIAGVAFAAWLFNHGSTADFLIDTENELRNKVTWPSKKEEINSSIVVVVAVLIIGIFVFLVDLGLTEIQEWVYQQPQVPK
jgi:preprotein translocase subunit SecE